MEPAAKQVSAERPLAEQLLEARQPEAVAAQDAEAVVEVTRQPLRWAALPLPDLAVPLELLEALLPSSGDAPAFRRPRALPLARVTGCTCPGSSTAAPAT